MDQEGAGWPSTPAVLEVTQDAIVEATDAALAGLYLCGSLASGGFDPRVSDVDLIAVLTEDPSDVLAARLQAMHERLAAAHPLWDGRLEVVYVSQARLRVPHEPIPRMAVISPGEPFHVTTAGPEWCLHWYPAREEAIALVGPALRDLMPEIPKHAFLTALQKRLGAFRDSIRDADTPGACAYAILTTCRGLFTLEVGHRPSKVEAAEWVARQHPEWSELISSALEWRQRQWEPQVVDPAAVKETRRFVREVTEGVST